MVAEVNPNIGKAYGILKELSRDEKTRLLFEAREKAVRDEISRMEGSYERGEKDGEQNKAEKVAINLLNEGMLVETIAKVTELSVDTINKLKERLN